jgi:hydroxyethylthiazole kinase-like sugar kinase family protein
MWITTASDFVQSAGIIVITAAALQATAYLFSSQIMLRLFLLMGTALYLLYYFTAANEPLWPAIVGTGCIATTSVYGFFRALANRSTFSISKAHLPVFEKIGEIEPGAFRKLMSVGRVETYTTITQLTEKGVVPDRIWFILQGEVDVVKHGHSFALSPHAFVGEISVIGRFPASADVFSRAGTTAVVWDRARLLALMKRDERFRTAVEALLARDMAIKLAQAVKLG